MSEERTDGARPERDQEALADLAEAYCQEIRRGGQPDVEEYAARLPALAAEIREVFPALALLEKGGRGVEARRAGRADAARAGEVSASSGGFLSGAELPRRRRPRDDGGGRIALGHRPAQAIPQ